MHTVCVWEFGTVSFDLLCTDHLSVKQKVQDRGLLIVG